ncbi:sigma-E processing peptidase SpoIIGA [Alicyclobacillus fodiniaquatilis]|uniref:Sigma-E processing peptidase SpoIIGA n=1 Tax=Alicyclobacillus fodiniaquatilis TaxID=1661150 RepID=A0ABW4JNA6_9BACL
MPATPVVYIDVVWFVNLVMDTMLLWTTGWLLKRKMRRSRVFLGGLTGACYALLLFFPTLSLLTTWPGKALMSVCMVWLALPKKNILDLIRLILVFYFVSFVFAGAAVACGFAIPGMSLGKALSIDGHGLVFTTSGETLALMVAVPLCIWGMQRLLHRLRKVQQQTHWLYTVEATFANHIIRFVGLLDSGNQLYDPVSRRPVSLVDLDVLLPVLPEEVQKALAAGSDMLTAVASVAASRNFTLVPFQGASGQGLTIALKPDHVYIKQGERGWQLESAHLFAVYPGRLNAEGTFRGILHMDMMNGVDSIEGNQDTQGPEHEVAYPPPVALHSNSSQTSRQP